MSDPGIQVAFLSGGERLHLQHGPIDLIIGADGDRFAAFVAAQTSFRGVLQSIVDDLDALRAPMTKDSFVPAAAVPRRMHDAALPFCESTLTPMICVAGSVADHILHAIVSTGKVSRAYVNNGGDIAIYLGPDASFKMAVCDHLGARLGDLKIAQKDMVAGVATSGRHGRSFSMGLADAVTVLAKDAATADTAATLIANEVDLPGSDLVMRQPACDIDPASDLGRRLVVTDCKPLDAAQKTTALGMGLKKAKEFLERGLIIDAALFLQGHSMVLGTGLLAAIDGEGRPSYA